MRADNKDTIAGRANPVDPRAMQDPANNPTPGEPPLTVADEEVERLLQQAESLTKEIVDDVGETPSADAAKQNTGGQFGTVEPDSEAAVELVAQDVAQLTDTITAEPSTAADENMVLPAEAPTNAPSVASDLDIEAEGDPPTTTADMEPASQSTSDEPTLDEGNSAAQTDTPDATLPETLESAPAPDGPSPRRGFTSLARHVALYSVRSLIFAVPNACIRFVMLLDLPFRGISPGVKSTLGVIGLISLLMGGVAMMAPKMMRSNPYALMPPLPRVEEPPAAGHGGEAKSEHMEAAMPAHDEKKPEGGGHH